MQFSEVLNALVRDGSTWTVDVPESWLQGRSVFGGLQTALAIRAMRALLPVETPLRVATTTFVAPVPAGRLTLQVRALRAGKSVTHLEARLGEDGNSAIVVGVFGSHRESAVSVVPRQEPVSRDSGITIPHVPGLSPKFTQHVRQHWLMGGLPFTGSSETRAVIEVDLKDAGPTGAEHVAGIADAIPPIALSHLRSPSPGSSVTWTLEFLRESFAELPLAGYRLDAELTAGAGGYTSQSVMVWGPDGKPAALSRQTMVVFG
ncbi:MAG TPA: thioesterase family protein [Polyangiaceae bacterium]|nr:thioesterase family protein [Polyangiaceae bacterium]